MVAATLGEIAAHLGGELIGDPAVRITRIGPLDTATPSTISFLSNPKYQSQLASSQAGCVIVAPAMPFFTRAFVPATTLAGVMEMSVMVTPY